eukprot:4707651-Pyramimonas_sp.AAC.2
MSRVRHAANVHQHRPTYARGAMSRLAPAHRHAVSTEKINRTHARQHIVPPTYRIDAADANAALRRR